MFLVLCCVSFVVVNIRARCSGAGVIVIVIVIVVIVRIPPINALSVFYLVSSLCEFGLS